MRKHVLYSVLVAVGSVLLISGCGSGDRNAAEQEAIAQLSVAIGNFTNTMELGNPVCSRMTDSPIDPSLYVQTAAFDGSSVPEYLLADTLKKKGFEEAEWLDLNKNMVRLLSGADTTENTSHRSVWKKPGKPTLYVVWEEDIRYGSASGCVPPASDNPEAGSPEEGSTSNVNHGVSHHTPKQITVVAVSTPPQDAPVDGTLEPTNTDVALNYLGTERLPAAETKFYLRPAAEQETVSDSRYTLYEFSASPLTPLQNEIAAETHMKISGKNLTGKFSSTTRGMVNATVFASPPAFNVPPMPFRVYNKGEKPTKVEKKYAVYAPATINKVVYKMVAADGKLVSQVKMLNAKIRVSRDSGSLTLICPAPVMGRTVTFTQSDCTQE